MNDFEFYAAQTIDGIAYGSIYGLFALSLVLLFRANKLFNFAQTEIATLLVMFTLLIMKYFSFAVSLALGILLSFTVGCLLHFGAMRFITERRSVLHSSEAMVTIGFFTVFNSLAAYIFGDDPQPFPSAFGDGIWTVAGIGVSYHSVGILVVALAMTATIYLCYRYTAIGLVFEAVAENIMGARLRGIRASNVLALAWGFTTMTCVIGALLIAPVLFVTPSMLTSIFAYSLISVMIGGLESPGGALTGGIIVGVTENLASNMSFIGSELKFCVVVVVAIIILVLRPRGLWGRAEIRRV